MQPATLRTFQFGPFRFDAETAELSRRGMRLRLQPQPARMLLLLLSKPGKLITREMIQSELWSDGTVVDYEVGVNRCVRQLRTALRDDSEPPRYIRTVPKSGYCFVAPVRRADERNATAPASSSAAGDATEAKPKTSIAVLPFKNLTGDPQDEYFGDGLVEEITNVLAQIDSLRVIARTSAFIFKSRNEDIRTIAEVLGVNHVLEGSVRRLGARIRVVAQLIRSSDGTHISSKRYDCEHNDLFALQDEISADIARQFNAPLKRHKPTAPNPDAYRAFLEGRFHWRTYTPAGFERALACYRRASALDSTYASAFTGIAEAHITMVIDGGASAHDLLPKAEKAARTALELDEQDSGAHGALALVAAIRDYDWKTAREHFHRALELGATTHARIAYVHWYLLPRGELREALMQCERVISDDPLFLLGRIAKVTALYWSRSYVQALECCEELLELDPRFAKAWQMKANLLGFLHRHDEAKACAHKLIELLGSSHISLFTLGVAHVAAGELTEADQVMARIKMLPGGTEVNATAMAAMCMLQNDVEGSVRWMAKAIERRDPRASWMHVHPCANSVHSDPRYRKLVSLMKLPTGMAFK